MKPARFDYARPESLAAALSLLARHGADAVVLAGGQSLMPMLNLRMAQPAILLDINRIPELASIDRVGNRLIIGSTARHNAVRRSHLVADAAPLLRDALAHVAHDAIRNRGTLGGSLALADPAAELPACALCLQAEIIAASVRGERRIAADRFFKDLYTTDLAADELIVRLEIPLAQDRWRFCFDEVARRHGDFAIVGLAMALQADRCTVTAARIVLFGVESSPRRARAAEATLIGTTLADADAHRRAGALLASELTPTASGEYPPAYRRHLADVLLRRALARFAEDQHERL